MPMPAHHSLHDLLRLTPLLVAQFGLDFSGFGAALEGFLADVLTFLVDVIVFIWNALVFFVTYLLNGLIFLLKFFYGLLLDVAKGFRWLWDNVVKTVLTKLVNIFLRVRSFLQRIFGPVIAWLRKARALLDKYFNKFVRPYLNMIRHVRQVLQIFRLLGVKWAARLDARLALVEQHIVAAYETLRIPLNQVISFLQLIADPTGILRRVPVLGAIIRDAAELNNEILQVTQRPLTGAEADAQRRDTTRLTPQAQASNFADFYSKRQLPPELEQSRKNFLDAAQRIRDGSDVSNA